MRIGQVNKDNYMEYMKLFGVKGSKTLENFFGKDKAAKKETSWEEIEARLIASGHLEEGMHIREGDDSWKKIVPVSEEIKEKLIATVRRQFITNGNGMSEARDGDEIGAIMKEYRVNIPPSERLSVTWTLGEIVHNESVRLLELVRANDPTWDYGKQFDKSILLNTNFGENGFDIKV